MKKYILLFILIQSTMCSAQVSQDEIVDRLYYTGKLLGYLKYHHTTFIHRTQEWDSVTLKTIEAVKTAPTQQAYLDSLTDMVESLGPLTEYIEYNADPGVATLKTLNLRWIEDPNIPIQVRDTLDKTIANYKNQALAYIYKLLPTYPFDTTDNMFFRDTSYPEENKRILALYRYWNLVEYTYQFKENTTLSWDDALKIYLKEFIEASSKEEYALSFLTLSKTLNDSDGKMSSQVISQTLGEFYAPFRVRYIDNKTIVTTVLDSSSNVKVGDELVLVESSITQDARDNIEPYIMGSNKSTVNHRIDDQLMKGKYGKCNLTFLNESGDTILFNGIREQKNNTIPKDKTRRAWYDTTINECNFGVIDLTVFDFMPDYIPMLEQLWEKDAWIIDLRGQPKIDFRTTLMRHIYNDYVNYYYYKKPNLTRLGEFYNFLIYNDSFGGPCYKKTIILLVDEFTEDYAERFAISFQAYENLKIIGSTTEGSGANDIAIILLPGKITAYYTLEGAYDINDTPYYRNGLKIDEYIRPTQKGIREGKDEVMEFALDCRHIIVKNSSDISVENKDEVILYPNPFQHELHIKSPNKTALTIHIYDMMGREIQSYKLKPQENTINTSNLDAGMYLIFIEELNYITKILKQ